MMTDDRLLYVFGLFSPKTALVLSMALRYIPVFLKRMKLINRTQTALGLYKDDNAIDAVKGGARVFNIMVTWALENGIITADSMASRGYGIGKRTFFSVYGFTRRDNVLLIFEILIGGLLITALATGNLKFVFYPEIKAEGSRVISLIALILYGIFGLLPVVLTLIEEIKWKYLLSKI